MDLYADLQTNTALSLQYNLLSGHPSLSSAALSVSVVFRAASQLTLSSETRDTKMSQGPAQLSELLGPGNSVKTKCLFMNT